MPLSEDNQTTELNDNIISLLANMSQLSDEKTKRGISEDLIATKSDREKLSILPILVRAFLGEAQYNEVQALEALGLQDEQNQVRQKLERWLRRYLYLPEGETTPEKLQPLPSDIRLAVLLAKRNALGLSQPQLKNYLREAIIPAMQRFHDKGEPPEFIIDLFVEPAKGRADLQWTEKSALALLKLAAYLETQSVRDRGFWGTYALLPNVMDDDHGKRFLPACAAIYHKILTNPPSQIGVDVTAKVGNNFVSRIMDALRDFFGGSDADVAKNAPKETLQVPNRIHALSAVCAANENATIKYFDDKQRHERLQAALSALCDDGLSLPGDTKKASQKASAILTMTNVLGAWHCPDEDFFGNGLPERFDDLALTTLVFAGTVLRMELLDEDDKDELGNAFSNLANMTRRSKKEDEGELISMVASACLASAGLWYLADPLKDDKEIFIDYRGVDIALRLVNYLDDLPLDRLKGLKGLPAVLSWIDSYKRHFDEFRLLLLLEKPVYKEIISSTGGQFSRQTVADELKKLTEDLAGKLSNESSQVPILDKDDAMLSFAKLVRFVLLKLLGEEDLTKYAKAINTIADKLVSEAEDVDNAWKVLYGPATFLNEDIDHSKRLGLIGPLVAMKDTEGNPLYTQEEWNKWIDVIKKTKDINPATAALDLLALDNE